jgi:hypothetical protein
VEKKYDKHFASLLLSIDVNFHVCACTGSFLLVQKYRKLTLIHFFQTTAIANFPSFQMLVSETHTHTHTEEITMSTDNLAQKIYETTKCNPHHKLEKLVAYREHRQTSNCVHSP